MRVGSVEPQAQRQLGQRLVTRGGRRQHPVEQALEVEEEANGVGLGVVEVAARDERLQDALRLQRRPQITGGEPVQAVRLRPEAAADTGAGQCEERPYRPNPELVQTVPERRIDAQPAQPHPPRPHPFDRRIVDHRHRFAGREGPGDGMGAEPREPDRDRRPEAIPSERKDDLPRPPVQATLPAGARPWRWTWVRRDRLLVPARNAGRRRMEVRQPGSVQPEDPRIVTGRFDIGAESEQALDDRRDTPPDVGGRRLAGVQGVGQRQAGAVTHPDPDAGHAGLVVDLEDHALRLVAIHHRHRPAGPAGVALQQELQWECRQLNARHPVHGTTPRRAIPGRAACP